MEENVNRIKKWSLSCPDHICGIFSNLFIFQKSFWNNNILLVLEIHITHKYWIRGTKQQKWWMHWQTALYNLISVEKFQNVKRTPWGHEHWSQPNANTPYMLPLICIHNQQVIFSVEFIKVILIFIRFSAELRNGGDGVGAVHCDSTAGMSLLIRILEAFFFNVVHLLCSLHCNCLISLHVRHACWEFLPFSSWLSQRNSYIYLSSQLWRKAPLIFSRRNYPAGLEL